MPQQAAPQAVATSAIKRAGVMRAMLLREPAPVDQNPLTAVELPIPEPHPDELLIRVTYCGICRTDLHLAEGELPSARMPVIPGHQIVGVVEACGAEADLFQVGDRVGAGWLRQTCGHCVDCHKSHENLCKDATFNGYSADGGFAEFVTVPARFAYPLPHGFSDLQAAPLLCAGIIGYRCLRVARAMVGGNLGFYGFGSAAHIAIQIARHWGAHVFVCTRDERHRRLAADLGAAWVGGAMDQPPEPLAAAIIFAPAGELVPAALAAVGRGGTVVLGGIHMSDIPAMPYRLLYGERMIRSVMNNTREDGREFLELAASIPIHPEVEVFPLAEANRALRQLKGDAIRGAGILQL